MEDLAAGMMVPLCLHWFTKGAVPEAEHVSMVEVLSCTVFEVSPESLMCTSEGGAARNMHTSKRDLHIEVLGYHSTRPGKVNGKKLIHMNAK